MSEDVVTQLKPGQYRVMRTSSYGESPEPPCDGAYQIRVTRVDRRLTDDPKKVPSGRGTDEWWYDRGTNHRVEDGCICRDLGVDTLWVDALGLGFTLVRRSTLEALPAPWFYHKTPETGEDLTFSYDVRRADMRVGLATGVRVGHLDTIERWHGEVG